MYARPEIEGEPTTLGVSGMLWRDALIMYDRQTRSLWSQVNGKAVAGPLEGQRLRKIPSQMTTWGKWKRRHPATLVLVKPPLSGSAYEGYFADPEAIGVRGSRNPDGRIPGKELVLGLEREGRFAALQWRKVEGGAVVNGEAMGVPLVLSAEGVYERRAGGRVLHFEAAGAGRMRDRETASLWSSETGAALEGPLRETVLERVDSRLVYWGVWSRFHPDSEIVTSSKR